MNRDVLSDALNELSDRHLLEAALYAPGDSPGKDGTSHMKPKNALRTLLIAAVLTMLLSITAYAVYQSAIHARVPEKGEELNYQTLGSDFDETGGTLHTVTFDDLAMVIHFDAVPDSYDMLMKFHWLPEPAASDSHLRLNNYYDVMDFFQNHTRYVGWEQKPLAELLAEAELTEEEAKEWLCGLSCDPPSPEPLLNIGLTTSADLYENDVILGWSGNCEAKLIREGTLGVYELLEVQVDSPAFYESRKENFPEGLPADMLLQNHLFLFEPEQRYLIHIGGSDCAYSFETLEKIAENIEVRQTAFPRHYVETQQTFILMDLGRG